MIGPKDGMVPDIQSSGCGVKCLCRIGGSTVE